MPPSTLFNTMIALRLVAVAALLSIASGAEAQQVCLGATPDAIGSIDGFLQNAATQPWLALHGIGAVRTTEMTAVTDAADSTRCRQVGTLFAPRPAYLFRAGSYFIASTAGPLPINGAGRLVVREGPRVFVLDSTNTLVYFLGYRAPTVPVITSFSTPAGSRSAAQQVVSFTDAGVGDTHTAAFNWGDGVTSTVYAGLAQSAGATHSYASAGFFSVAATVTDDDGMSAATGSRTLAVYDPLAGYTTASGYIQGVMLGSKTYFSHNVRYSGGGTPTGTFEIHGTPSANMTSNAFEYLVVQGTTGTFRGTGTLTNGTPVTFLVRGIDYKPALTNRDRIRIKVWNSATGAVVYDSQPNTVDLATPTAYVAGGSFSILH